MRILAATVLLVLGLAPTAQALTVRDLIELSRAGLGDEVLLALIEVNRGVYAIDAATLMALKAAGVSDRVIAALIRSGREQPPSDLSWQDYRGPAEEPVQPPQPQVVVIEHHVAPQIVEVPVAVPVYVTAPSRRPRHVDAAVETTYVPFQSGRPAVRPETSQRRAPSVYWGFGGQRRPDAWGASPRTSGTPPPPKRDRGADAPPSDRTGEKRKTGEDRKASDSSGKTAGQSPKG